LAPARRALKFGEQDSLDKPLMEFLSMNTARFDDAELKPSRNLEASGARVGNERFVNAREFRALMVSHRRMVRENKTQERVRGLRDLDTGEVFLIDERRLYEAKR
jgi:hypothetical protein